MNDLVTIDSKELALIPAAELNSEQILQLDNELALVRTKLMLEEVSAFIGALMYRIHYSWADVGTACTNGKHIYYDPKDFIENCSDAKMFTLAHELWHVALRHVERSDDRIPVIWNIACDIIVNRILIQDGFKMGSMEGTLPYDEDYDDMSTEQIYEILLDKAKKGAKDAMKQLTQNQQQDSQGNPPPPEQQQQPQDKSDKSDDKQDKQNKSDQDDQQDKPEDGKNEGQGGDSDDPNQDQEGSGGGGDSDNQDENQEEDQKDQDGDGQGDQDKPQDEPKEKDNKNQPEQTPEQKQQEQEKQDQKDRQPQKQKNHSLSEQQQQELKQALGMPSRVPLPNDIMSPKELSEQDKQQMEQAIVSAYQAAQNTPGKNPGTMPGELQLFIDQFNSPKLPWGQILHNCFNSIQEETYSFRRPNRSIDDPILRGRSGIEGLDKIYFYLDISGSISDEDILDFNSEVAGLKKEFNPQEIVIVTFDTRIHDIYTFTKDDDFNEITVTGRGGTDLEEVYEHINDNRPDASVIFTDLYVDIPRTPPQGILIWVVKDNPQAEVPYGTLIHFDSND